MVSRAFRQFAILFAIAALVLGLWSGVVVGTTFGLLVFALFIIATVTLLFYSTVNNRVESKIAQLR